MATLGASFAHAVSSTLCARKVPTRSSDKTKRITFEQLFHLVRRLLILAAALWYVAVSVQTSVDSLRLLNGVRNTPVAAEVETNDYMIEWMGTSTIRSSPFVIQVLRNDTSPRNYTVYLEANSVTSTQGCSAARFNAAIYSNRFLRAALYLLIRDTAYNITELASYEQVLPIIDCSFTSLVLGYDTVARVFYMLRHKQDHNNMLLAAIRFSMQDYRVHENNEYGPVGLTHVQFIRDMSAPRVLRNAFSGALGYPFEPVVSFAYTSPVLNNKGWWAFTVIPPSPSIPPREIVTSCRTGFFISSDDEQANIKNQYWHTEDSPIKAISEWRWEGEPLLKDSWAWVHLLHIFFALSSLIRLGLLSIVILRNYQKGRVWIGDAFVSVSSSLLVRGALILVSWYINGYWSLMEFCLHDAHTIAGTQNLSIHLSIMRADLLNLFLATTSVIGSLLHERIDPVFAMVVFQATFAGRISILRWFPRIREIVSAFARSDILSSVLGVSKSVAQSSPLRLWTTHALTSRNPKFIFSSLAPFFLGLALAFCFTTVQKLVRHFCRGRSHVDKLKSRIGTAVSHSDEAALRYKRNLTLFEIATGVELLTCYGVMSDFDNFLYIKGMKYASADGIYGSGFVIANDRFLISTEDWFQIVLLKITKIRMKNIYVFAVTGYTVEQRAQLVYADTLTWSDLFHLNVAILS